MCFIQCPHPSGDSTDDHLQVQNHHDGTRVARHVLVLGSGESVHKTPSKTSIVGESVDSTIQQLPDHCNSPRLARDALVLGPSAALNRDSTSATSVNNPS